MKKDFEEVAEVKEEVKVVTPKKYIVTVTNLAIRGGAGREFDNIGIADAGITMITEIKNNYGKLADGSGWVSMDYCRKAD